MNNMYILDAQLFVRSQKTFKTRFILLERFSCMNQIKLFFQREKDE